MEGAEGGHAEGASLAVGTQYANSSFSVGCAAVAA
jgi:hypothetical protein